MKYYIGLDVSMKETFYCVVDAEGEIIFEGKTITEPDQIYHSIKKFLPETELVGLESGSLSHWLTEELLELKVPVKCIDARHCASFLSMRVNKTDRNDARGIAEVMRCKVYREVAVKPRETRALSSLLTSRKQLVNQRVQIIMSIRGILKPFGVRLGSIPKNELGALQVLKKISHLEGGIILAIEGLVRAAIEIMKSIKSLDSKVRIYASGLPDAKILMSIPGVGPVTALKYLVEIGDIERFKKSRAVGAYVGLTPKQYASGETQKQGRISKCGSKDLRSLLVEAAVVMLTRTNSWSKLKAWGMKLMKRTGLKKAATAVARKLAVIMHCMLKNQEGFQFSERRIGAAA